MSFQRIESAINTAKLITHWNSLLIEYNHKRSPNEYVCYNINFASTQLLNDIITSMCNAFLSVVKKQNRILIPLKIPKTQQKNLMSLTNLCV